MHRYPAAKTAIALACVALSSGAIGASIAEPSVASQQCVNIQANFGTPFGVPSARGVSGGGTVFEVVPAAVRGTDAFASPSTGRIRLEPVTLTFSGFAELRGVGSIVTNLFTGKDFRLPFIDIASLNRVGNVLWSHRFVGPFVSGFSVPELSLETPGPANFGVEFVADQKAQGAGCSTQKGNDQVIDKSRFVVEAGGVDSRAVLGVGAFKINVPVTSISTGADGRGTSLAPGRPTLSPVDLVLNPMYAGPWVTWFQENAQGKAIRKNVTIRLLDKGGQPGASIMLVDAWPSRFAPLYGNDGRPERVGMTLQYDRVEIR